jgi:mRNA interferase RelE/StbE
LKYKVTFASSAAKSYKSFEKSLIRKINTAIPILENNPYKHPNIKRLKGKLGESYRYRIGKYRIIYNVNEGEKEVTILLIIKREDAYR